MTDKPDRVTEIVEQLRKRNRNEASRRNSAYDHFGMDNTPESVDPTAWAAADLLEALTTRSQPGEDAVLRAEAAIIDDLRRVAPLSGSEIDIDYETGCVGFNGTFRPIELARAALNAAALPVEGVPSFNPFVDKLSDGELDDVERVMMGRALTPSEDK